MLSRCYSKVIDWSKGGVSCCGSSRSLRTRLIPLCGLPRLSHMTIHGVRVEGKENGIPSIRTNNQLVLKSKEVINFNATPNSKLNAPNRILYPHDSVPLRLQLLLSPIPQLLSQLRFLRMPKAPTTLTCHRLPVMARPYSLLRSSGSPQLVLGSSMHIHQKSPSNSRSRPHNHARLIHRGV